MAPEPSGHNGIIRSYRVFLRDQTTNEQTEVDTVGSSQSITLSNLEPFRTYRVTVAAHTIAQGPLSAPLQFTTLEDGERQKLVPTAARCSGSIQMAWVSEKLC